MALRSVPNPGAGQTAHELPPLPYDFAALEPHIDAQTMQIHHDKHHASPFSRCSLCRYSSEIRTGCANERSCGPARVVP